MLYIYKSAIPLIYNERIIFFKRPAYCMIFKMALPPLSIEPLPTLKGTKDYYKKIKYCYLKLRKFHHLLYNFLCRRTHLLCVLYHSLYSLDVMVVLSSLLFGSHVKVKERKQMENKKIMSLQIIFASMRLLILSTLCCYFIH